MSHTPCDYAPGGQYVLFLGLLGFTAFVRASFQKKAEETDDREKEFELAQKQDCAAEGDREYRRFHEHLRSPCADQLAAAVASDVARVLRLRVRGV